MDDKEGIPIPVAEVKPQEKKAIAETSADEIKLEQPLKFNLLHQYYTVGNIGKEETQEIEALVTPENIHRYLDKYSQEAIDGVISTHAHLKGHPPSDYFRAVQTRADESHMIDCAVNGMVDFRIMKHVVDQYTNSQEIPIEGNDDLAFVNNFLQRQINLREHSRQLYELDVIRRIGLSKNDPRFVNQEAASYIALTGLVRQDIAAFREANQESLTQDPKIAAMVDTLEGNLQNTNLGSGDSFYHDICNKVSHLASVDFEVLNEGKLASALIRIETSQV